MGRDDLMEQVLRLFEQNPDSELGLIEVCRQLKVRTHPEKSRVADLLDDLVADDELVFTNHHLYRLNVRNQVMEGTFQRKRNGRNSFLPDGEDKSILVMERNSKHALGGDRVKAVLLARRRNHTREAEVIEIIKRAKDRFVGELKVDEHYAFLISHDRQLATDIFIPKANLNGGKTGDKAVVEIVEWPDEQRNPVGRVVDVLGRKGDNDTEMHAILAEFSLPYRYPEEVEQEAEKIADVISPAEIARREDLRNVLTMTIDPHDAKDFDDALSIRKTEVEGEWEIGIHIADVTYYVTEGSLLDREAYARATSVYLVDRTIPMLPERLCNYLCSLRPNEDKLTYSTIFRINSKGEVLSSRVSRTVIRSDRRFNYEEVQAILEQNGEVSPDDLALPGEHPAVIRKQGEPPVGELAEELITLNRIAKLMRAERFRHGTLSFDRAEVRFDTDPTGHPTGTYIKVAKDANRLVEEYMLLANRYVAELIGKVGRGHKAKTFVYRIHDVPSPEKLDRLHSFVSRFGHDIRTTGSKNEINNSINRMLRGVKGRPEQEVIESVTLRAMAKAKYSTHNIGHYGLGFRHYTHFTSPIRRYPDDMVHRLLTRYLDGGRSVNQDRLEDQCEHCSEMEQVAANAERASIKYKQVEFMADRLGQEFEGKVSGVTEFGIYVELDDNACEGMVPIASLADDYYEFDERAYRLVGRRSHRSYSLGDRLLVRVQNADLDNRRLDFELIRRIND